MGYRTKEIKVVFGALIGSVISLFANMVRNNLGMSTTWMLAPAGIVMLYVAFSIKSWKEITRGLLILFLSAICGGGICEAFNSYVGIKGNGYLSVYFLGMVWFGCLFLKKGFGWMKEQLLHRSQNAFVTLRVQGKEAYCKGFWDSGNSLRDPITGRPVVLLEKSILEKYKIPIPVKGFRVIPFHSVGMENGVLKGFVADELLVQDDRGYERCYRKTVVAIYEGRLSMKEEYQMILNPKL